MQALQQRAGVRDVPPDGGVGPGALPVAVETQVQLNEPRHRPRRRRVEAQHLHPARRHLGPNHLVVVEADPTGGLEAPGRGLADVVHQGGQPQHQVGAGHRAVRPRLEVDSLVQHGQAVLVHVLVPVVLVDLQAQGRQLGQHVIGQAGGDQVLQPDTGCGAQQQLLQLGPHPLGRDDLDALRHRRHRRQHLGRHLEPQLRGEAGRPHHPQRVVVERLLGAARCPQHPGGEVGQPAERVDEAQRGQLDSHRVDGEVPPRQVALERVPIGDGRLAGRRHVGLGPVRRDLDDDVALARPDRPVLPADLPARVTPPGQQTLGLLGTRIGRQVEVGLALGDQAPQEGVTDRAAHQGQPVPRVGEAPSELMGRRGEVRQLGDGAPTDLVDSVGGHDP